MVTAVNVAGQLILGGSAVITALTGLSLFISAWVTLCTRYSAIECTAYGVHPVDVKPCFHLFLPCAKYTYTYYG